MTHDLPTTPIAGVTLLAAVLPDEFVEVKVILGAVSALAIYLLKREITKLDKKLEAIDESLNAHSISIAKLEERTDAR